MTRDSEWHEVQYLPSKTVGNTAPIFDGWRQRAAITREKYQFQADIKYGPHAREIVDFYPAVNPRGCVVYVHGGYWTWYSKFETSWVVDGFVEQGLSVALINYPLCPEVAIGDIRTSCAKAFAYLYREVLSDAGRKAIVVTGHSAGGHLAAAHLVEDWTAHGLPENPISGVIALSGIFDVAPLMNTSLNQNLKLTAPSACTLNLCATPLASKAKLVLAVGEKEPEEFHRQSAELAQHWQELSPRVVSVEKANHFTVVDSLAAPGAVLNTLAIRMTQG
ncbi:alpha/beta hydrolase [Aestuariivirga litoralis]|uniref:alpha/beta hydrolase n=1 Tax=Aestuariivirga litoralis TaxID=2650924 RepID=UPI0018C821B8|nr:alpha/beta hydrolase [Aestuariivirga litoralis]MBG1233290.1 alpha/beta hydrolase [Aestuariivirga litoralis]